MDTNLHSLPKKVLVDWFEETTPRFLRLVLLAAVVSTLLSAALLLEPLIHRVQPSAQTAQTSAERPNVIWIVVDALTAEDMSLYGYSIPTTPNLERLAPSWTVYDNHLSSLSCTVANLPVSMTGRYNYINQYYRYGDMTTSQPGWVSLASQLKQAGYQTLWQGYHTPGFYHLAAGFDQTICSAGTLKGYLAGTHFLSRAILRTSFPFVPVTLDQAQLAEKKEDYHRCRDLGPLAASALDSLDGSKPFFIFLHYFGVHGYPYPGGAYLGSLLPISEGLADEESVEEVYGEYDPQDQPRVDQLRLRYDEGVMNHDQQLGEFIETLKARGLYDSALIIITADHGQVFNNGYVSHCTPLLSYAEQHIPLIIKYPHQSEGKWLSFRTTPVDLAPTVMDVTGLSYQPDWFDGISLLHVEQQPDPQRITFFRKGTYSKYNEELFTTTGSRYRLVLRDDETFLFDFRADPEEKDNLLYKGVQDAEVERLAKAMERFEERQEQIWEGKPIQEADPLTP